MGILLFLAQADFAQKKKVRLSLPDNKIYTTVDQMPEYPGGPDAWRRLLERSLSISEKDVEEGWTGPVKFAAIVEKSGSLSNIDINGKKPKDYNSIDSSIYKMIVGSKWQVGKLNGKIVRVRIWQTVIICLQ